MNATGGVPLFNSVLSPRPFRGVEDSGQPRKERIAAEHGFALRLTTSPKRT
jgi:hypothetical protein